MENKNTILAETRSVSPVVAGIGNHNVYAVPADYFDTLAVQVLLRIAVEEKAGTDPVLNVPKNEVYQAPAHYFDTLASDILHRIQAQETGNAQEELELLSPLLVKAGKANPFTSPEGYFKDFSDNIMAGVKAVDFVNEELENLSPAMAALKNKPVYQVPEGYFDAFASTVLQQVRHQPAKIVSIGSSKKMMRYAAAAVVAAVVLVGGYFYAGSHSAVPDIAAATAKMPDQEMEDFLYNNTVALAEVGTETDSLPAATATDAGANADDTKDLLADIPDDELQKYVDQHSETPVTN